MIAERELLPHLNRVRAHPGGGWIASCTGPNHKHGDRNPSLVITERDDKVLLYCHAGCGAAEILSAIGLDFSALYPPKADDPTRRKGGRYSTQRPHNAHAILASLAIECGIVALSAQLARQHYSKLLEKFPESDLKWFDVALSQETYDRLVVAASRIDAGWRLANGQY
jgi:putative DNA primase/helicase